MARLTDPRAAGFDSAAFRDAFNFATAMGAPDAVEERVTFTWDDDKTYSSADVSGKPWDWKATPTSDTHHDPVVLLNIAVELAAEPEGEGTAAGTFREGRGTLTLLDTQYEQIKDADHVHFGGRTWEMGEATPLGLFDVTVWSVPIFESVVA